MDATAPTRFSGGVIWLTGLSGAGKSTLAVRLEADLRGRGWPASLIDGDELRRGLSRDLGFGPADRAENVRRAAEVAGMFAGAGVVAVVALISPLRADRRLAREILSRRQVRCAEVYVHAPLAVCEQRDPKGLYRRARAGGIPEFTGISAPYEAPENPALELRTDLAGEEDCTRRLVEFVHAFLRG